MSALRKIDVAQFLPEPKAWTVDPVVRRMLDYVEQMLRDSADEMITRPRCMVVNQIRWALAPLDLICASISREHADYERLAEAEGLLRDVRHDAEFEARETLNRRLDAIAALLAKGGPEPRADR